MEHYEVRHYATEWAEAEALDRWLDNLETLFIALTKRRMTTDQLDRYGRLLQGAEKDALRRIKGGPRIIGAKRRAA